LLFQRDIVEKSLEAYAPKLNGNSGKEFLEKIVQVGFDLPLPEKQRLYQALTEELEKLVTDDAVLPRFDKQRWLNIFHGGINTFFGNLRDVRRYLASLSFHISLFKNQDSFEVNPIDLIALEALRVFEPEVYCKLPALKGNLFEDQRRNILDSKENEKVQRIQESILGNVATKHKDSVKQILKLLFPNAGWFLDGYLGSHSEGMYEDWLRDLRVCHSTIFDRYFTLAVPEGDITQAELDAFLSVINDRDALLKQFRILHEKGLAGPLLDRLEVYKQKIELKYADSFIPALFDIADELPDKLEGFEDITPISQIARVIYWYLQQEKDTTERAKIIKKAIEASNSILLPVRIIDDEIDLLNKGEDSERYGFKKKDLDELKSFCLARLIKAAQNGGLINVTMLPYVLHCWSKWGGRSAVREWIDKSAESSDSLIRLLSAFVQNPTSIHSGEAGMRRYWVLDIDNLDNFCVLESIQKRVSQLDTNSLSPEDQRTVRVFEIALKRKNEGRKLDYGFDKEDEYEII